MCDAGGRSAHVSVRCHLARQTRDPRRPVRLLPAVDWARQQGRLRPAVHCQKQRRVHDSAWRRRRRSWSARLCRSLLQSHVDAVCCKSSQSHRVPYFWPMMSRNTKPLRPIPEFRSQDFIISASDGVTFTSVNEHQFCTCTRGGGGRSGTVSVGGRSPGCFCWVWPNRSIPKRDKHIRDIIQQESLGTDML